jgi:hypothetical protein
MTYRNEAALRRIYPAEHDPAALRIEMSPAGISATSGVSINVTDGGTRRKRDAGEDRHVASASCRPRPAASACRNMRSSVNLSCCSRPECGEDQRSVYASLSGTGIVASSSGRSSTLSCSFGSVLAITAIHVSLSLALYGKCGMLAGM